MPTLYARFFNNSENLFLKVKEVAGKEHYSVSLDDPEKGLLHLQKKVRGKSIKLVVYVGTGKDRGITVSIFPGDEGWYMDIGKKFIRSLHEAAK